MFKLNNICFTHRDIFFAHRDIYFVHRDIYFAHRDIYSAHRDIFFRHLYIYFAMQDSQKRKLEQKSEHKTGSSSGLFRNIYFAMCDTYFTMPDIYFTMLNIYFAMHDIYFAMRNMYFAMCDISPGSGSVMSRVGDFFIFIKKNKKKSIFVWRLSHT